MICCQFVTHISLPATEQGDTNGQARNDSRDKGLVVQLEDIVNDETGDLEETERLLRDWPL
jgi:hypothetical protein